MFKLTDFDIYLFGCGTHERAYEKLGAHPCGKKAVDGTHFAAWAPNAEMVSVIGDFNAWTPGKTLIEQTGQTGIWQGVVPEVGPGDLYQLAIKPSILDVWLNKSDPYAFSAELRPHIASRVVDLSTYTWTDDAWMEHRDSTEWNAAPISIYEVHLGSWRRDASRPDGFLSYLELAETLPSYVRDLGFTHVQLMPVSEFPLDRSWGYQVTGYFAPTARHGTPQDFMHLVDAFHQAGIGVLLDWVPAHFPRDAHGLALFDGTHVYEHADPRQGEHRDWGTLIFNYGRNQVRSFLISNAHFWLDMYHIDGLRVDAVASMLYLDYSRDEGQWIPNEFGGRENLEAIRFLRQLNTSVRDRFPSSLMIAEESTAWPLVTGPTEDGGLGFNLKWNMGWMHDSLTYMKREHVHRRFYQNELTFPMMYAFSEKFVLPLSHDEVVHGKGSLLNKMAGDAWQKFANLRLLYAYMFGHPGKKLLFMGAEIAQWSEWDFSGCLDWDIVEGDTTEAQRHRGIAKLVTELNRLYVECDGLHADQDWSGFQWIDFADEQRSIISFIRVGSAGTAPLIFVCNFSPAVFEGYRLGVPESGGYSESVNTDSLAFGGSRVGNPGIMVAEDTPHQQQPYSIEVTLPPLAALILRPERSPAAAGRKPAAVRIDTNAAD